MWKRFIEWFASFRKSEAVKEAATKFVHIAVEKVEAKIDEKINETPAPAPVTEVETLPEAPAEEAVAPAAPAKKRAQRKRPAKKAAKAPKAK